MSDDEAFVRAWWPGAWTRCTTIVCDDPIEIWNKRSLAGGECVRLGTGPTEAAAWTDAARRIREEVNAK